MTYDIYMKKRIEEKLKKIQGKNNIKLWLDNFLDIELEYIQNVVKHLNIYK